MAINLRDLEVTDPIRKGRTPIADAMDPQSALRRSEERYRCLVQAISSIVWTSDPEGRFIMPQPGWAAYTGQTYDEYRDHGWWMAFHPEDRPGAPAFWLGGPAAQGDAHDVEGRLWHAASDSHRYFRCRAVPIRNPDGKIREWIGTITDIHDARMSEERNRALETRYRAVFDQAPVAIQIFRPDGLCVHANDTWERIWQAKREEVVGKCNIITDPQLVEAGFRPLIESAFAGAVVAIPAIPYDPAKSGKAGRARWVEGTIYPVRDAHGWVEEVVLMVSDVTSRIEAEQAHAKLDSAHAEALERLERTLEVMPLGCATTDTELRFTYWNAAAERIFGFTADEVLGQHPGMVFMTPESMHLLKSVPEQLLREGGVVRVNASHTRKDGAVIQCEWHCSILRSRSGAHLGFIAMCRETDQRLA